MKSNQYRSHPIAAAVAAAVCTAALLGTVIESFEPAKLRRFYENTSGDQVVALERRAGTDNPNA